MNRYTIWKTLRMVTGSVVLGTSGAAKQKSQTFVRMFIVGINKALTAIMLFRIAAWQLHVVKDNEYLISEARPEMTKPNNMCLLRSCLTISQNINFSIFFCLLN